MPDYNPAIATSMPPQQLNLAPTLEAASNLQINQQRAGLLQVQQMAATREYNALQAADQAGRAGEDMGKAYLQNGGGDPSRAQQFQTFQASAKGIAASPGGMMPEQASQLASMREHNATTANLGITNQNLQTERDMKNIELRGRLAQSGINDTSDENWNDITKQLLGPQGTPGVPGSHISPQGYAQIQGAKTPEQRKALAQTMLNAANPDYSATVAKPPGETLLTRGAVANDPVNSPPQVQAAPQQSGAVAPPTGPVGPQPSGSPPPTAVPSRAAGLTPQQMETSKLDAQQYAKLLGGLQGQANTSAAMLPHIQLTKSLINSPDFYSGTAEGPVLAWKRLLSATGLDPNAPVPQEAFRKMMAANILHQVDDMKASSEEMGAGSSRIFSSQIDLMEKAAQNPDNSIAANRFLTELSSRAAERNMTIGDMAADYKIKHGSLDVGFEKNLRNWQVKNPMFTTKELSNPSSLGAAPQFREGQTATNAKGEKKTFTNGAWQ